MLMKKRKICIITGSRAEWGLLRPLASEIRKNKNMFILRIIATSAHLSPKFGLTHKEIEKDGFAIDRRVSILSSGNTQEEIIDSVSLGMKKISRALTSIKPEVVFLLGDRFEAFAAAAACLFLKIPVAHIHGGELTEGALDDKLRHAITKMAYLHFVAARAYKKRVIQMGEDPSKVFNVGALGMDNIAGIKLLTKKQFEERIDFKLGRKNIMVTFHPATCEDEKSVKKTLNNLLKAIDPLRETRIIFTKPSADMHADIITGLIGRYVNKNKKKAVSFTSMGAELYLNALRYMDVVAGNSSSGIIEAPSFGIPTVNIGSRQKGRIRPESVIDAEDNLSSIKRALKKAFSADFRKKCKNVKNPYGDGNAAKRIVSALKKTYFTGAKKKFFDIDVNFDFLPEEKKDRDEIL